MADRRPLASLSDSDLEQRLIDLGTRLYPTTTDLATPVRHRLESEPVRRAVTLVPTILGAGGGKGGRSWAARLERRALWLVAALLLIAIVGGLVLFPEARHAIADRLGLQGVLIRWVDETPPLEPPHVGAPLLLGRPVTLDEAQAAVDFPVLVPAAAGFDTPAEIYLLDQDQGAMISFVYPARSELPASDETGVGALLTQFQGEADRDLIEKGLLGGGAQESHLEAVTVGGDPGF